MKEDINKCHCLSVIQQNASQKIFFATKFRKTKINMGKHILRLLILVIRKIAMYEYWYDYIKPKYEDNATFWYIDTDSLIVPIKADV